MQELTTFISNHLALSIGIAVVFFLVICVEFLRTKRNTLNINPAQATQLINRENAAVIDIRSNDAFRKGHIIDAQSISAAELRENTKKLTKLKSRPIILVCNAGVESQKLAAQLLKGGYNAYSLSGGMRAWSDAQMPLIKE